MSLQSILDRPIAFQRPFVDVCGSVTAALMLSQAVYWANRCNTHNDGKRWFYKSQSEWQSETGLSRYEQEGARKILRGLGILEEKKQGIPAKLYFSVNFSKLRDALMSSPKDAGKPHTSMLKTDEQECGKPAGSGAENQHPITENTTETTTDSENRDRAEFVSRAARKGLGLPVDGQIPFPPKFTPNEKHIQIASERGVDLYGEVDNFRDHHVARNTYMLDWGAAFNVWLRNAKSTQKRQATPEPETPHWNSREGWEDFL